MTLRIAAIGAGHWHAVYDPAYLKQLHAMSDVRIVGIHDPDAALAAKRAAVLGGPPVFSDYRAMLESVRPDFVFALGTHRAMAEAAHHLLDQGYPFMMEKPMGFDAQEVLQIAEKAERLNAFAAVPMATRYAPFVALVHERIAGGSFGPLSHIYVRMNRFSPTRYVEWDSPWMLDPFLSNGGSLRNFGAHGFDLFLRFCNEEARVTGAQISRRVLGNAVEEYASVLLQSSSGVLGTIEVGNVFPTPPDDSIGSKEGKVLDEIGWLRADGEFKVAGRDLHMSARDGVLRVASRHGDSERPIAPSTGLAREALRDTLECWRGGKPPPATARDCYRAMSLVDQAYAFAARSQSRS